MTVPGTPAPAEAMGLFSFGPKFTFLTALYRFLLFLILTEVKFTE